MRQIIILLATMLCMACANTNHKQGIKGEVLWVSGNQMPGPGKNETPRQGIVREIHIFEAAYVKNNPQEGSFYPSINTPLIATTASDQSGAFEVKLPEGKYSVFTKEQGGFFANRTDGDGCINCIVVSPKEDASLTITVDYEAAY